jgi:Dihaem cytochrome c
MKCKLSIVSLLLLSTVMLGMSTASFSSDDKSGFFSRILSSGKTPGVAPVANPQYLEECGSCHFPYQPGLLPERSWSKLMTGLEDHFAENAELPLEDANSITDYLIKNAADHANYKRSKKIMKSLHPNQLPLRVSKTPYFIKKHNELSRKMVQDNPKVGSISNCKACHTKAEKGSFSEREILIPGFGAWED